MHEKTNSLGFRPGLTQTRLECDSCSSDFFIKVFRSLYLLNMLMDQVDTLNLYIDQVDTLHVGRYWSEVLCCTIMTHPG